jgi:hypothetical protein
MDADALGYTVALRMIVPQVGHDWWAPLKLILEAGVRRCVPPASTPIRILCITGGRTPGLSR